MTEALKAMIEAMLEEMRRQWREGGMGLGPYVLQDDEGFDDILVDGRVDLEKVARAGLRAIPITPEMSNTGRLIIKGAANEYEREQAESAFRGMIAEITKESE